MTPECVGAVSSMHVCGLCSGIIEKPCSSICLNVMKSCFQQPFNDLNLEWDNFVSAMEKLSERLLGPFNIVMVVEPINIKISEAIMNFQVRIHLKLYLKFLTKFLAFFLLGLWARYYQQNISRVWKAKISRFFKQNSSERRYI